MSDYFFINTIQFIVHQIGEVKFKIFCEDVLLVYDGLDGTTLPDKARDLLRHFKKNLRLLEFFTYCQELNPHWAFTNFTSFTTTDLLDLVKILQAIPLGNLHQCYKTTNQQFALTSHYHLMYMNRQRIVEELANYPETDGQYPLTYFVRLVLEQMKRSGDHERTAVLTAWLNTIGGETHIADTTPKTDDPPYLQIVVDPDQKFSNDKQPGQNNYPVQMYLWQSGRLENVTPPMRQMLTFAELPSIIDQLFADLENNLPNVADLHVEIFLPYELFSFAVEEDLKKKEWGYESELGLDHWVCVRSVERLKTKPWHGRWQKRWQILQKHTAIHQYDWHTYRDCWRDENVSCVGLTFMPLNGTAEAREFFYRLIREGVPVAIWPRRDEEACQTEMNLFIEEIRCAWWGALPDLVRRKRRMAFQQRTDATNPPALGRHLTLLWDDPHRLPTLNKSQADHTQFVSP